MRKKKGREREKLGEGRREGRRKRQKEKRRKEENPISSILGPHRGPGNSSSVTTPLGEEAQLNTRHKLSCLCLLGLRLEPGPAQGPKKMRLSTIITGQPPP